MQLKTIALLSLLIMLTCRLSAVSPDISLPEWQKTEIGVSDWSPEEGILLVKVSLEAKNISIRKVSCQLNQKFDSAQAPELRTKEIINAGDKAVFLFRLHVKPEISEWIECDLRAQPDQDGLRKLVETMKDKPLTMEILQNEVNSTTQPVLLGKSFPIFVAEDIAMGTTAEMAFRPSLEHNGKKFYIWLPPETLGAGITSEAFKALRNSVRSGNYKSAISACNLIIRRTESNKQPLTMTKGAGETFVIPDKVALEMLLANRAIFALLDNPESKELSELAGKIKPCYSRAFIYFNLAQSLSSGSKKVEALDWVKKALVEIPSWPTAQKLKKSLEK